MLLLLLTLLSVLSASQSPNEAIVELLLRCGAQVNRCCSQGLTALHEACRHGRVELCKLLLEAGASLKVKNIYGIQPLFTAAQTGHVHIIHLLAERGVALGGRGSGGRVPHGLDFAAAELSRVFVLQVQI